MKSRASGGVPKGPTPTIDLTELYLATKTQTEHPPPGDVVCCNTHACCNKAHLILHEAVYPDVIDDRPHWDWVFVLGVQQLLLAMKGLQG